MTIKEQLLKLSAIKDFHGHEIKYFTIRNDNDGGYVAITFKNENAEDEIEDENITSNEVYDEFHNEFLNFFNAFVYYGDKEMEWQKEFIKELGIKNIKVETV